VPKRICPIMSRPVPVQLNTASGIMTRNHVLEEISCKGDGCEIWNPVDSRCSFANPDYIEITNEVGEILNVPELTIEAGEVILDDI
jgi:hypothetical protein